VNQIFNSKQLAQFILDNCIPKYILNEKYIKYKPYVIGISGTNSAVGKSTVASKITEILGLKKSLFVDIDNWINVDRQTRYRKLLSGMNPSAYNLDNLLLSLNDLIVYRRITQVPIYNHSNGKTTATKTKLPPSDVICLAGGSCLWPEIRPYINYSICISTHSSLDEKEMIIERNIKERNYSLDEATEEYQITNDAYIEFVIPYKDYADLNIVVNKSYEFSFKNVS